jgi:hypothetical protein
MNTHTKIRRFPRYHSDLPVIASIVSDREVAVVRGRCYVISQGGLGAAMCIPIEIGYMVSLELPLPSSPETVRLPTIVRNRYSGQCGFEFLALSDREEQLVRRYCRQQARLSAVKKLLL